MDTENYTSAMTFKTYKHYIPFQRDFETITN